MPSLKTPCGIVGDCAPPLALLYVTYPETGFGWGEGDKVEPVKADRRAQGADYPQGNLQLEAGADARPGTMCQDDSIDCYVEPNVRRPQRPEAGIARGR